MSHKFAELVKHHDYLNHAVFVVGSGRSGTTLIQSLLDGHPQLLVWPEEYGYYTIWNDYFPNSQKGDRYQGQVLRKCLLRGSGAKDFGKEHNAGQVSKPYLSCSRESFTPNLSAYL